MTSNTAILVNTYVSSSTSLKIMEDCCTVNSISNSYYFTPKPHLIQPISHKLPVNKKRYTLVVCASFSMLNRCTDGSYCCTNDSYCCTDCSYTFTSCSYSVQAVRTAVRAIGTRVRAACTAVQVVRTQIRAIRTAKQAIFTVYELFVHVYGQRVLYTDGSYTYTNHSYTGTVQQLFGTKGLYKKPVYIVFYSPKIKSSYENLH